MTTRKELQGLKNIVESDRKQMQSNAGLRLAYVAACLREGVQPRYDLIWPRDD